MSYFIIVIISINDMFTSIWTINLGFLKLANFGSAIAHLRGCFCFWNVIYNIWLNVLPSDSFMSILYYKLGFSIGEFKAVQLIVLVVFVAVDACMLVHFLEISFKWYVGL